MDENYYTPKIEDFHAGFEYEENRYGQPKNEEELPGFNSAWYKETFKVDLESPDLYTIKQEINKNNRRVKYLDKLDIEDSGWYYKATTEVGLDYFLDLKTQQHSIIYDYNKKRMVVTVRDNIRKEDYTAFIGTVNNKSELKKIMSQLNIL